MEILVYSEQCAKRQIKTIKEDFIWIQIKTLKKDSFLPRPNNCIAKLNLSFYDTALENPKGFDLNLAYTVWDWLFKNTCNLLIINCEAGLSRSAGLAIGIDECLKNQTSNLRKRKPLANNLIIKLIKDSYYELQSRKSNVYLKR